MARSLAPPWHLARKALALSLPWLLVSVGLGVGGAAAVSWRHQTLQRRAQRAAAWEVLQRRLDEDIAAFRGEAGVVVEDLETGWRFTHQSSRRFPSASVVKLAIMAACFRALADGRLDSTDRITLQETHKVAGSGVLRTSPAGTTWTIAQLMELMIGRSDNTAANLLIDRLGMPAINQFMEKQGWRDTNLSRKMMAFDDRARGIENFTTAADLASILTGLYQETLVSRSASRRSLALLTQQEINDRIPARLPAGTVVAHKTGLERRVCHDAGIVVTPHGDYLIAVLTTHPGASGPAKAFISTLAEHVYAYMTAGV